MKVSSASYLQRISRSGTTPNVFTYREGCNGVWAGAFLHYEAFSMVNYNGSFFFIVLICRLGLPLVFTADDISFCYTIKKLLSDNKSNQNACQLHISHIIVPVKCQVENCDFFRVRVGYCHIRMVCYNSNCIIQVSALKAVISRHYW